MPFTERLNFLKKGSLQLRETLSPVEVGVVTKHDPRAQGLVS